MVGTQRIGEGVLPVRCNQQEKPTPLRGRNAPLCGRLLIPRQWHTAGRRLGERKVWLRLVSRQPFSG